MAKVDKIDKKLQGVVSSIVNPQGATRKRRGSKRNDDATTRERIAERRIKKIVRGVERTRK